MARLKSKPLPQISSWGGLVQPQYKVQGVSQEHRADLAGTVQNRVVKCDIVPNITRYNNSETVESYS